MFGCTSSSCRGVFESDIRECCTLKSRSVFVSVFHYSHGGIKEEATMGCLRKIDAQLSHLSKIVSALLCFLVKRILVYQFGSVVCNCFLIMGLIVQDTFRRNDKLQRTAAVIRKLPIDLNKISARVSLQGNGTVTRRDGPGSVAVGFSSWVQFSCVTVTQRLAELGLVFTISSTTNCVKTSPKSARRWVTGNNPARTIVSEMVAWYLRQVY
jgi:hypothetical protein